MTNWPNLYAYLKSEVGFTDADLERVFGLAPGTPPGNNFRNSSAKSRYQKAVVLLVDLLAKNGFADAPWTHCLHCEHVTAWNYPGDGCEGCGVVLEERRKI